MRYIAKLLKRPNTWLTVEELQAGAVRLPNSRLKVLRGDSEEVVSGQLTVGQNGGHELVDQQTIKECEERLRAIQAERAGPCDPAKIDDLDEEAHEIRQYLAGVKNIRGTPRRVGDQRRTASRSVRQAIGRAIKRMHQAEPPLTRLSTHLKKSIQWSRGSFLYKAPFPPLPWKV